MIDSLDSAVRHEVATATRNVRAARRAGLRVALLVASAVFIVACGDGGGDDDPANGNAGGNPPAGNQAPTISGTPLTSVMQNTAYSFTPTASDANNDALTFSVLSKPSWATFSPTTGKLSGTPTSADVNTYSNIRISVSDGLLTTNLAAFSVTVVATATGAATLTWNPPTATTDGGPLNNLAGYKVYWGTTSTSLTNSRTFNGAGLSSAVIDQLTPATWYFAVTAFDSTGNESVYSNLATKTVL